MRILLSNDDGYFAPGIQALFQALEGMGEIVVVAPEQNRSGASNSLTLDRPLFLKQAAGGFYFVNGTPTDCVHLAVTGMLDYMPDIIVSGINHGANMGDDTIYSGTVAAATEGFLLGAAILMETSIAMVLLSRVLKYRANRWANIIVGIINTAAVSLSLFATGITPTLYYMFFAAIGIPCTLFIVWYAWKWPNPEDQPK